MILKPKGAIVTRYAVEKLAKEHADDEITEIDLSEADVIGGSTMHQLICSFPGATLTGLDGFNKEEFEWVMKIMEDVSPPDLSLMRAAAEPGGTEAPDQKHDTRRNRGLRLQGIGLVASEPFERDALAWLRFTITPLGQNVLKKKGNQDLT